MPTKSKSKKPSVDMVLLSSSVAPRPRAGPRTKRGGQITRGNVLALASSSARPRAGPARMEGKGVHTHHRICGCKARGKGIRPTIESLFSNTFGSA